MPRQWITGCNNPCYYCTGRSISTYDHHITLMVCFDDARLLTNTAYVVTDLIHSSIYIIITIMIINYNFHLVNLYFLWNKKKITSVLLQNNLVMCVKYAIRTGSIGNCSPHILRGVAQQWDVLVYMLMMMILDYKREFMKTWIKLSWTFHHNILFQFKSSTTIQFTNAIKVN